MLKDIQDIEKALMESNMYWLITYQQNTGHQYKMANKVTDMHPADWLLQTDSKCPGADTVVVFAIEINEEQYNRMQDEI